MELKNGYVREFETEITALKLGTTHYSICVSGKIKYVSLCVPKSLNNNNNKLKFRNTTIKISLYSAVFNLIIPETFMIKIGLVTYTRNYIDHTKIRVKLNNMLIVIQIWRKISIYFADALTSHINGRNITKNVCYSKYLQYFYF